MSEDTDPLRYVFARPLGIERQYVPFTLEHADTLPVRRSELVDFVAELKEKGLECVYYPIEKLPSDLAQLVRKVFGVEEVEAPFELAPSEAVSLAELAKRGWK